MQLQSLMAQRKLEIHVLILAAMVCELPVYSLGVARSRRTSQGLESAAGDEVTQGWGSPVLGQATGRRLPLTSLAAPFAPLPSLSPYLP